MRKNNWTDRPNCLTDQDIGGIVPVPGQALVFAPAGSPNKWNPGVPAPAPAAIGVDFVYQPGGPSPVGATNVYTTEAALWAAVNAALLVTAGPLTIAIDSTFVAPAVFALPHNYQDRVRLVGAVSGSQLASFLKINDTAVQTDVYSLDDYLTVETVCATGPAFAFTGTIPRFFMGRKAEILNLGAHAAIDVPAGQSLTVIREPTSLVALVGAGAFVGLPTATSGLVKIVIGDTGSTPTNVVSGVVGSTFQALFDASFPTGLITLPNFLGALSLGPIDLSLGIRYFLSVQPALLGNPTSIFAAGLGLNQQQATMMHHSPVNPVGAAYTVDSTQFDGTIVGAVAGLTFTIPAGFPIGRELTFIDASGGVGGNAFVLQPAAGEHIGALGNGAPATYTQVQAKALTIKKTAATEWRVISSTTLT